jgi:hypothetical protein
MNRWCTFLLCGLGILQASSSAFGALSPKALASSIPPAPDGERFLFVVDTSSAMEDLQPANEVAIFELIQKGIYGHLRPGDTYGVWTYSKETKAGQFPMRVWEAHRSAQQGTVAAAFLNEQTYEKSANLKVLMDNLTRVIRAITNVTILLISDGSDKEFGTPFDQALAADYKRLNKARRQARRPFVTTFCVRDGWYVDAKVNIAGTPIQLPERRAPRLAAGSTNAPPTDKGPKGTVLAVRDVEGATNAPGLSTTAAIPGAPGNLAPTPITPISPVAATAVTQSNVAQASPGPQTQSGPPALTPIPGRPKVFQIVTKSNSPPQGPPSSEPAALPPDLASTATILTATTSLPAVTASPVVQVVPPQASVSAPAPSPSSTPLAPAPLPAVPAVPPSLAGSTSSPAPTVIMSSATPGSSVPASNVQTSGTKSNPALPLSAASPLAPAVSANSLAARSTVPPNSSTGPGVNLLVTNPPASSGFAPKTLETQPIPAAALGAPMVVAARERQPTAQNVAKEGADGRDSAAVVGKSVTAEKIQPLEALVSAPDFNWLFLKAGVLLVATFCLLVLRRGRATTTGSIITQSMERR